MSLFTSDGLGRLVLKESGLVYISASNRVSRVDRVLVDYFSASEVTTVWRYRNSIIIIIIIIIIMPSG